MVAKSSRLFSTALQKKLEEPGMMIILANFFTANFLYGSFMSLCMHIGGYLINISATLRRLWREGVICEKVEIIPGL